ncbi:MAG TPA: hypothetical protein VJ996_03710, partial [Solirubrobacteraceae bacterium]|nr:hypothetical protein [Solirubrobacteraceae bacterium]
MATRTIVTSQPDVECEVCERRLLRGEQPDVFLAAGRRRIVCELCAPRATYAGWMRETDGQSLSLPPLRPRRGRSLFERLRQVARPASDARGDASGEQQAASFDLFADPSSPPPPSQAQAPVGAQPSPPFDAAQGEQAAASDIAWNASAHAPVAYVEVGSETGAGAHAGAGTEPPASHVEHSDEHRQALVV